MVTREKIALRWKQILGILAFGLIFGASCKTERALPTTSPTSQPLTEESPVATMTSIPTPTSTVLPDGYNPFTGQVIDDPSRLQRLPIMVKISNFPASGRPHAGLSFADIVFEYYIGEYANRFLAIFYGKDTTQAGPIRSGRLVDAQLANLYQGLLVYGNADERVDKVLEKSLGTRAFAYKESPCPPICGTDPHSVSGVFTDTTSLTQYTQQIGIEQKKPNIEPLNFDESTPPGNGMAHKINVHYAPFDRGEWLFDASSQRYLRWIENVEQDNKISMIPLIDRVTGEQLAFDNVIVLFSFYIQYNETLHDIDLINNQSGERALFFRNGVMTEGLWKATNSTQPIAFYTNDEKSYNLKPGNSWIILLGLSSTLKETVPGEWEAVFYLP